MGPYKEVKSFSLTEAAYVAGLIDGEGTISLTRKHRIDNRQLVVSISSTERHMLEYVRDVVGAGRITNKRTYQPNHSPSFTYTITNRQALTLLKQIAPYLRSYKVDRANLILEHYLRLTPRNGRYSIQLTRERETFIQQFLSLRPEGMQQTLGVKELIFPPFQIVSVCKNQEL